MEPKSSRMWCCEPLSATFSGPCQCGISRGSCATGTKGMGSKQIASDTGVARNQRARGGVKTLMREGKGDACWIAVEGTPRPERRPPIQCNFTPISPYIKT